MNICGHDYTIRLVDPFEKRANGEYEVGRSSYWHQLIEIDRTLPQGQIEEILLHEIGHVILFHYGHEYIKDSVKEAVLDAYANGLRNLGVGQFLFDLAMLPRVPKRGTKDDPSDT